MPPPMMFKVFTKFLIDPEGNVVKRYAPKDKPSTIGRDIEKLLD